MNINQKTYSFFETLNYFILAGFFVWGSVFSNKLTFLWGIIACCIFSVAQKKNRIDIREVLLAISLILYVIFTDKNFSWGVDIVFLPIIFSLLGKYMINGFGEVNSGERRIGFVIGTVVLGYTIHGILNSFIFFRDGFSDIGRAWLDVWDKTFLPATQHVIYYLPCLALLFFAIVGFLHKILLSSVIVLINIFFLYTSIISMSRTSIVIWGIILVLELLIWGWQNFANIRKVVIYFMAIVVAGIIVGIYIENTNILQLEWLNRNGGILNNIRFKAQINVLKQIFIYPKGGYQMDLCGLSYAHNVWLDLANAAGIIPFMTFVSYTTIAFIDFFKMLRSEEVSYEIKYGLSGVWASFVLYYMVEPALEASVLYLVPWIYINGIIYGYNSSIIKKKNETGVRTFS